MIDPVHSLSIRRQVRCLDVARSSVYCTPVPLSDGDEELMRLIDKLHLNFPFMGSRQLRRQLQQQGHTAGRRHIRTLMKRMGIEALYGRPRTTKPASGHRIYPYLLRNRVIDRPNKVWALDITYLPMRRGFVYFVAVMDWATRRILSWRLSNTMTADFCVGALQEALARYGAPEIVNTDQGSQFTSSEFVKAVQASGAAVHFPITETVLN
jgi:putative transposase